MIIFHRIMEYSNIFFLLNLKIKTTSREVSLFLFYYFLINYFHLRKYNILAFINDPLIALHITRFSCKIYSTGFFISSYSPTYSSRPVKSLIFRFKRVHAPLNILFYVCRDGQLVRCKDISLSPLLRQYIIMRTERVRHFH